MGPRNAGKPCAERAERSDPTKQERVIRLRACGATARQFSAGLAESEKLARYKRATGIELD
jgi:hypothetical protein